MKRILMKSRQAVFGLVLASALGFGATQAFAGTGPEKESDAERACSPVCKPDCGGFTGTLRGWGCLCCG